MGNQAQERDHRNGRLSFAWNYYSFASAMRHGKCAMQRINSYDDRPFAGWALPTNPAEAVGNAYPI